MLCISTLLCLTPMATADTIGPIEQSTEVHVKKADPGNVIKDGIIGNAEYEPIENELDFSWWSYDQINQENKCEEFAENVRIYFSWDEVHGLNIAAKVILLEDPVCTVTQPEPGMGDNFLWQFGMTASVVEADDLRIDIAIASIGYNTDTDAPLYA